MSRRFLALATVLVTLNLALWLASSSFGLGSSLRDLPSFLFGSQLMRAEVVLKDGSGLPRSTAARLTTRATGSSLTLQEADGRVVVVQVSPTAEVRIGALAEAAHRASSRHAGDDDPPRRRTGNNRPRQAPLTDRMTPAPSTEPTAAATAPRSGGSAPPRRGRGQRWTPGQELLRATGVAGRVDAERRGRRSSSSSATRCASSSST